MRIAQVNVYFKPFMVGGAEWYVYNISKHLVKRGHDVEIFTANKYAKKEAAAEEVIDGIIVHRLPLKLDWTYRLKIWNGLNASLSKTSFDIIHTYDYAQSHSRTALSVGSRKMIPTALTVFDVHSLIPRQWYKQMPIKIFERFFASGVLNSADKVLVRAPTLVPPLVSLGLEESKIVVTPSGINDESLGSFDGRAFLKDHSIEGYPVILFLGRLNPLKGPQNLIRATPNLAKKFPDVAVVFVGSDQSGYISFLRDLSRKLGVEKRMHFLGPIYDFEEKMKAYASCDVFVLPTSYEGTSQSIFEAMSQARPIISTSVGGIPFQIENGKEGILIPYEDIEALEDSITKVCDDRKFAAEIGKNAKDKVRAFRYSLLSEQLSDIYEELSKNR